ncbi:VirB8/TrbF family protein [Chromobacterium piscinae]|uniref:VirB8/TrbF family protein n=1 Tax=Chromobacterium piscinae TaxID=686831 RepID=UPI001E50CB9D|nr:VirB8/TrbF family protein [Chromobacterium piscinae]MCD5327931.1 hypothetical protein [Chromobacterium piscinae]
MGFFSKKEKRTTDGAGDASLPAAATPWAAAQQAWDDRMLRLAMQVQNWQRAFMIMAGITCLSVVGIAYIGSQSKIIPYIVEVDKLGRALAVRAVDGEEAKIDPQRAMYREVIDFFEDGRTIIGDNAAMKKSQGRMWAKLPNDSACRKYIIDEFAKKDPFTLNQSMTVTATVKTALKLSNKSWQVEWEEQAYTLKGEAWGPLARYKANIETKMTPPADEKTIRINPYGFYVTTCSWTKQL